MRYLIVIEPTSTGYSAYSPDLEGCVATGATRDEVERNMRGAIEFHIDGLQADGLEVPEPRSSSAYVELEAERCG
ncbi:MAG TPA: type II toxin-antitoxin system HicB family antitoxin [Thermoanaerobaculales bacterium]|nr:type II toxin-antitoxin system HicB family antitoxin [Thermoanaerobaculales bacterium]HQL28656.1 type II toxin-antitoxin system HicB family antitoxin [Thermoanaerobaculales bacterium]HQN96723.1 type II toxin-antitoxin system HicB family antitoxin [Thermoanaerobaculales bacterium]